jgi:hypothetical protein
MESDAYDAGQFDRVLDGVWIPAHVEDAIAAIVDDADAAFGFGTLWPANWWDEYHDGQPAKVLYAGAAGVIWALDALRRSGHAETSLDLGAAALRTLELERTEPDASEDEHYRPGSLLHGETGPLLVACRLAPDTTLADDLHALVRSNVANPTDDISWGAPGTLLAALAMHEWTGEARWMEVARESGLALRARRGDDGMWRQDDDYRGLGTLHGAAGNTLALLRLEPDETLQPRQQPCWPSMRCMKTAWSTGRGNRSSAHASSRRTDLSPVVHRRSGHRRRQLGVSRRGTAARPAPS